jgi:hypothetical protein
MPLCRILFNHIKKDQASILINGYPIMSVTVDILTFLLSPWQLFEQVQHARRVCHFIASQIIEPLRCSFYLLGGNLSLIAISERVLL